MKKLAVAAAGTILFDGHDITGRGAHRIVRLGLVRTFQLTTLFQEMTALENVLLGLHLHAKKGFRQLLLSRRMFPREEVDKCREVLAFVGLSAHADHAAGHHKIAVRAARSASPAWARTPITRVARPWRKQRN